MTLLYAALACAFGAVATGAMAVDYLLSHARRARVGVSVAGRFPVEQ